MNKGSRFVKASQSVCTDGLRTLTLSTACKVPAVAKLTPALSRRRPPSLPPSRAATASDYGNNNRTGRPTLPLQAEERRTFLLRHSYKNVRATISRPVDEVEIRHLLAELLMKILNDWSSPELLSGKTQDMSGKTTPDS